MSLLYSQNSRKILLKISNNFTLLLSRIFVKKCV
jgi:hypothetical protein